MKKMLISFILGGIVFTLVGVVASTMISSQNVTYQNKTVNNALDELIKCYIDGEKYFSNYKNLEYSKKYKEEKAEKEIKIKKVEKRY